MFKGYDVRGVYGSEVTEEKFFVLGRAFAFFGGELLAGMDYRTHNASLLSAFVNGFRSNGGEKIVFLGVTPTPAVAFCASKLGVAITASHNPPEYCGAKPFKAKRVFYSDELRELKARYAHEEQWWERACDSRETRGLTGKAGGTATALKLDDGLVRKYLDSLPPFEGGLFDLGGGAACAFKKIFPKTIFDEPDPFFKKHSPEPKNETLDALKRETIAQDCVGFAFDGDADRVVVVDEGKCIDPGVLGAFFAATQLKKNDSIALTIDVQDEVCEWLEGKGFTLHYSAVGDVNVIRKAEEARAVFAMERSGHYSFTKHLLYSDALYAAALLSSVKAGELSDFASQFKNKTISVTKAIKIDFRVLEKLVREKRPSTLETIDGVKARFEKFCILVRASQTEPKIRVNVEAKTDEDAAKGLAFAEALLNKSAY